MKCPRCGEINDEGFRFCRLCGAVLGAGGTPAESGPSSEQTVADVLTPSPAHVGTGRVPEKPPETVSKLVATGGLLSGRTYTIGPKGVSIGRDPAHCQVVIADDEISRLHAWIGFDDQGRVIVRDCKSANGTFVNQVQVEERVLHPNDEISVGTGARQRFRVESQQRAAAPAARNHPAPAGAVFGGQTSVIDASDLAAHAETAFAQETIAFKAGGALGHPHVDLIVDRYAVKTLDIPPEGLKVGRDAARCQIVMDHPSVSSLHAEILPGEGGVRLIDHSTNGTFVDGRRVTTVQLEDGGYITFGRYAGKSLIFRTGFEPEVKLEAVDLSRDRTTIGRDPSNDVCINHPLISKHHAEVIREGDKLTLVDLGSTNGTFVNGIKVKSHVLQPMDRIIMGPSELNFTGTALSRPMGAQVMRVDALDITYQVPDRATGQPRTLLDGVSLVIKPCELIGFLGPSGAGKTTLMNVLNGFRSPSGGQVLYNHAELYRNLERLKSGIGFVPQEDIVHRQLSVRKCLYYAARLRLPEDISEAEIDKRVEEMLETLRIDRARWDNPVSTLSGGQRKRVSIGIELLPQPGVLFLDEPTAGLDPRTETLMMMLFRQLANQGATIVITTHLLASFGVLDKVAVLVQGRLAFYGSGTKLLEYFQAEAPADIYDNLTDANTPEYGVELKQRFLESPLYREVIAEPLEGPAPTEARAQGPAGPAVDPPAAPKARRFMLRQFAVLARRNWDLKFNDRMQTAILFLQAPLVALLVGLMSNSPNQVRTLFMAMFGALWFGCSNAVREIVDEQTIYRRERQTGLTIPAYVFSKLAVLSFVSLAQCVSMIVILMAVKHSISLSLPEALTAVLVLFLVSVNGTLFGLVISGSVGTPEKALALFPLILIPELLFSGMFLPVNNLRTLVPVTVEDLFEGKFFAQPEAKAKAQQMVGKSAPAENPPVAALPEGELSHQVVGAVAPSPKVTAALHKYTPAPIEGMPAPIRLLSALAISRWGLESMADLCIHGSHSIEDSAYQIINTVSISLHPHDVDLLERGLEAPASQFATAGSFPLPSDLWTDESPYLGILLLFVVVMTTIVLLIMKRRDAIFLKG